MGLEARCRATYGGRSSEGQARLEDKDLLFRGGGDFRFTVPLADVRAADARGGVLTLKLPRGTAALELGAQAEKWALKIRYPRSLMDKLGVKPGMRVSVLGIDDAAFWRDLEARAPDLTRGRARPGSELIVVGMKMLADLARLRSLRDAIVPGGAIWVVWPKGQKAFREDDVRAAGPGAGLVDVKVVSVSETLSGLKMMIPRAQRPARH
jgi:hypothetical protein